MTGVPVRAVLLDLEGTLYAKGAAIEGAAEAVAALRELGVGLRFLTNTDSKPAARLVVELADYGLAVAAEELFTPVVAAERLLTSEGARTYPLVSRELRAALPTLADEPPYSHVLVGDCRDTLDYPALDGAFRAVRDGAELLALQTGRYFKRADGDHLDTGAIVRAIEHAAGTTARVLGKPATDFFALAARSLDAAPAECVVVGDDATTDIAGGRSAGMRTVQVRTGKYADQRAEGLTGQAGHEIDSVTELPDLLRELVGP
ncbi:HAD-IA family hydrolase [Streptomyces alkaliterrae]|uniref:HAD-IA family hydrolase n=1 Tax=Streptomyces alkaliterrae TaxID=2213162 RepID=A0A5P0YN76_9ACTN|nr:HAD-IA family hydrolase [Streptomyces alkaliterrae]MBB1253549.1 HAD-IA family hydrolase [Streptomyces alkaliterrae]MBB1257677.1 HAD-IA family hydrolase [Streptomyces alkaliterrae]MQS01756.1 HAD-IA family hydrolase [Streptomyces alkaliterrae]